MNGWENYGDVDIVENCLLIKPDSVIPHAYNIVAGYQHELDQWHVCACWINADDWEDSTGEVADFVGRVAPTEMHFVADLYAYWGGAEFDVSLFEIVDTEEEYIEIINELVGFDIRTVGVVASVKRAAQDVATVGEYHEFCRQKKSEGWMIDGDSLFFHDEGNQFLKIVGDDAILVDVELPIDDDKWESDESILAINNTVVHGDNIEDTRFSGGNALTDAFELADELTGK